MRTTKGEQGARSRMEAPARRGREGRPSSLRKGGASTFDTCTWRWFVPGSFRACVSLTAGESLASSFVLFFGMEVQIVQT
eukprot:6174049-Pleurochrysis_carterae.AAC.5